MWACSIGTAEGRARPCPKEQDCCNNRSWQIPFVTPCLSCPQGDTSGDYKNALLNLVGSDS